MSRKKITTYCCVPWCNNFHVAGGDKRFYSFPKDAEVKEKWIDFVSGGSNWKPGSSSRICSAHFKKEQIKPGNKRGWLRKGAVPGYIYFICRFQGFQKGYSYNQ